MMAVMCTKLWFNFFILIFQSARSCLKGKKSMKHIIAISVVLHISIIKVRQFLSQNITPKPALNLFCDV